VDPLTSNPLAVLTFIVAPAVLTNASSVMGLQTANRFARAVDRTRSLSGQVGAAGEADPELPFRRRQLAFAERRTLLLVRALTCFYVSVGAFAASSFTSLLAAIFVIARLKGAELGAMCLALGSGVVGVGGLLAGSGLVVLETRYALIILREETDLVRRRGKPPGGPSQGDQR
jgi:hypothetical protein